MVWGKILVTSLIYMQMSSSPTTTCWEDSLFSNVYSCFLCQRLTDHGCVSLFLGSLFCSTDSCGLDEGLFLEDWFLSASLGPEHAGGRQEVEPLGKQDVCHLCSFHPLFKLTWQESGMERGLGWLRSCDQFWPYHWSQRLRCLVGLGPDHMFSWSWGEGQLTLSSSSQQLIYLFLIEVL